MVELDHLVCRMGELANPHNQLAAIEIRYGSTERQRRLLDPDDPLYDARAHHTNHDAHVGLWKAMFRRIVGKEPGHYGRVDAEDLVVFRDGLAAAVHEAERIEAQRQDELLERQEVKPRHG